MTTTWLDSLEDLSAQRWLKISGMYIFSVLQFRAVLLTLMEMDSLASLATGLLSWSIILKWEMLAGGWLLEMLCI